MEKRKVKQIKATVKRAPEKDIDDIDYMINIMNERKQKEAEKALDDLMAFAGIVNAHAKQVREQEEMPVSAQYQHSGQIIENRNGKCISGYAERLVLTSGNIREMLIHTTEVIHDFCEKQEWPTHRR